MDFDSKIAHVKELIQKREDIDGELAAIFGISLKTKRLLRCSRCGEEGNNAKTCPQQQSQSETL